MKRIYFFSFALALTMGAFAQSLVIENSLMKMDNASAIVQYNNYFASLNNPDLDEPFPYAVIRMDLLGEAKDIKAAKEKLQLNLGTMLKVEQMIKSEQNKIIFLVPKSVRNIELMCGDGCESQTLWNGPMHANAVYVCQVRYTAAAADASNQELASMMAQMNATLQQMQNNGTQPAASQTAIEPAKKSKPAKKTLPEGVGLVLNTKADMKYLGKKQYTLNGTTDMDNKEIAKFYEQNSPEAYKKYMGGKNCKIAGWVTFGVGIAAIGGGAALLCMNSGSKDLSDYHNWTKTEEKGFVIYETQVGDLQYIYDPDENIYYTYNMKAQTETQSYTNPLASSGSSNSAIGGALLGVGCALTVASIPLLSVGYAKCKNAYKTYNRELLNSYTFSGNDYYKYQQRKLSPMQLNLNVVPAGLGLSLKF